MHVAKEACQVCQEGFPLRGGTQWWWVRQTFLNDTHLELCGDLWRMFFSISTFLFSTRKGRSWDCWEWWGEYELGLRKLGKKREGGGKEERGRSERRNREGEIQILEGVKLCTDTFELWSWTQILVQRGRTIINPQGVSISSRKCLRKIKIPMFVPKLNFSEIVWCKWEARYLIGETRSRSNIIFGEYKLYYSLKCDC